MFGSMPEVFRAQYARTEKEADRRYADQADDRCPPELLPRDEAARSISAEVKAGRGSPHGGAFPGNASRCPSEEILRKLPSMYHQPKELADVDIAGQPVEVGLAQHMTWMKPAARQQSVTGRPMLSRYPAVQVTGPVFGRDN